MINNLNIPLRSKWWGVTASRDSDAWPFPCRSLSFMCNPMLGLKCFIVQEQPLVDWLLAQCWMLIGRCMCTSCDYRNKDKNKRVRLILPQNCDLLFIETSAELCETIWNNVYHKVSNNLWWFCWLHTKTEPIKLGDVFTPPGSWWNSGPLSRGCSQPDLLGQFFVRHSRNIPEPMYSRICLIRHVKGTRKKWRINANRWKLYHRSSYTLS